MRTSKKHQDRLEREDGCRAARRAVEAAKRNRSPLADPALHRLRPLG